MAAVDPVAKPGSHRHDTIRQPPDFHRSAAPGRGRAARPAVPRRRRGAVAARSAHGQRAAGLGVAVAAGAARRGTGHGPVAGLVPAAYGRYARAGRNGARTPPARFGRARAPARRTAPPGAATGGGPVALIRRRRRAPGAGAAGDLSAAPAAVRRRRSPRPLGGARTGPRGPRRGSGWAPPPAPPERRT